MRRTPTATESTGTEVEIIGYMRRNQYFSKGSCEWGIMIISNDMRETVKHINDWLGKTMVPRLVLLDKDLLANWPLQIQK